MRSIVIAFLVWQCVSHRLVSCRAPLPPTSGTTHSAIDSTIAHVDRKDSAIVKDKDSVAKISRSEIAVEQRPVVDTSVVRPPKEETPPNGSEKIALNTADRNQYPGTIGPNEVDVSGQDIDPPSERLDVAARESDLTLDKKPNGPEAGVNCGCGLNPVGPKNTKTPELEIEVDARSPSQQPLMAGEGAKNRIVGNKDDSVTSGFHGETQQFVNSVDPVGPGRSSKDPETCPREAHKIEVETSQEVDSDKTVLNDEILDTVDKERSVKIPKEPEVSAVTPDPTPTSPPSAPSATVEDTADWCPTAPIPGVPVITISDSTRTSDSERQAETTIPGQSGQSAGPTNGSVESKVSGNQNLPEPPSAPTQVLPESPRKTIETDPISGFKEDQTVELLHTEPSPITSTENPSKNSILEKSTDQTKDSSRPEIEDKPQSSTGESPNMTVSDESISSTDECPRSVIPDEETVTDNESPEVLSAAELEPSLYCPIPSESKTEL